MVGHRRSSRASLSGLVAEVIAESIHTQKEKKKKVNT